MTEIDYARRSGDLQGALVSACLTLEIHALSDDTPVSSRIRIEREIAKIQALLAAQHAESAALLSEITLACMPDREAA